MGGKRHIVVFSEDDELVFSIKQLLKNTDSEITRAQTAAEVYSSVLEGEARLVLLDGIFGEDILRDICENLQNSEQASEMGIIALLQDVNDPLVADIITAGADDVVNRDLQKWSFGARIRSQFRRIETSTKNSYLINDAQNLIEITYRLTGTGNLFENLYATTSLLSKELDVDRCSVVLVPSDGEIGVVIASSDDPKVSSIPINLKSYPEIRQVAQLGEPLVITDVSRSKLLEDVLPNLQEAQVSSVALFPVARGSEFLGVIFLRYSQQRETFYDRELTFCQTVANAVAIALRNNEILASLKAKSKEVEQVQTAAKIQLEALKPYEGFFQGSVDGMAVLNEVGEVVYINPVAASLYGHIPEEIVNRQFTEFLGASDRESFNKLLVESVAGTSKQSMDFTVGDKKRGTRVVSVAAGPLGEKRMALLTMRDVTDERVMARRLADAQERLIESEKKSAMMEVAGGAAHELNQPLTSVMASIAMLRKLLEMKPEDAPRVLNTMEQESERMAAIIRRLGKLTEYTTKSYVGDARIIDLERAADRARAEKDK